MDNKDLLAVTWTLIRACIEVLISTYQSEYADEDTRTRFEHVCASFVPRMEALGAATTAHAGTISASSAIPSRAASGKRYTPETLRDVARNLQKRISLTKLIEYDEHVRPYLAALMVAAVASMGEKLVVPNTVQLVRVTEEEFKDVVASLANRAYDSGAGTAFSRFMAPAAATPATSADTTLADVMMS